MQISTSFKAFLILICIAFPSAFYMAKAQSVRKNDVIVKRDSTRIQALITQMSYEKINYRDLGTTDSSKTFISLDEVARVLLKTGKIIHVRDSVLAGKTSVDSVGQYADLANLPTDKFEKRTVMANSDQLRDRYQYYKDKSIDGKRGAIVFSSIGVATLVTGLIFTSGPERDDKKIGNGLIIAGPVVGGALGLITFSNYKRNKTKANKIKEELERRNQPLTISNIRLSPNYDPFNKSGMLTLRMSF